MTITPEHAAYYLFEIVHEAGVVSNAAVDLREAFALWREARTVSLITGRLDTRVVDAERRIKSAIEAVLSGYARCSLFLFPAKSAGALGEERGARLRELLMISAEHPVANRELRNHWAHLDERLDTQRTLNGAVPIGFEIRSRSSLSDEQASRFLRLVDPETESVYVLGTCFSMGKIVDAVEHVAQQATNALDVMFPALTGTADFLPWPPSTST